MSTVTRIRLGALSAAVDSKGAQLTSLALDGREYLWQADGRWWPRSAPVLFPIVGTLRGGRASAAQGPCRMGRHGLARNYEHELVGHTATSLTYRLASTPEMQEAYPYDFVLEMSYALEAPDAAAGGRGAAEGGAVGRTADGAAGEKSATGLSLVQTFSVTNTGEVEMPFFLGGHPAFNVPVVSGEKFEDYRLSFARPWTATTPVINEQGLLDYADTREVLRDSATLPLTHELFSHDAIVLEGVPDSTVALVGPSGHGVRVDFEGFGHIGVWSAAADKNGEPAPFVALEPWCGTATRADENDVFEHKQGLLVAHPGETVTRAFRVTPL